jgi:transposase-like protein
VARDLVSGEKRISQVCRENSVCDSLVRRWKEQYQARGEEAFQETQTGGEGDGTSRLEARVRELEASLGRAHLECEFLRAVLVKKGSAPARKSP